jgi:predicted  nucleic acid-binding Zn-ribbon protein
VENNKLKQNRYVYEKMEEENRGLRKKIEDMREDVRELEERVREREGVIRGWY